MAQVNKPSDYFNTKLYTGTGATQSITGVNFQPDLVWVKDRTNAYNHYVYDVIRTPLNVLQTNATDANTTQADGLSSFDSDGFSLLNNRLNVNASGDNFVSWNWLGANGTASNTDGSITSTVSANTTSGFSIVSYTGTGSNATVGHGLGVAPKMIITKARGTTNNWGVYHESLGNTDAVFLNLTNATDTSSNYWNDTSPTSSVFSVGSALGTNPSATMIAYCFAEKKGFSKFGSYTGNGNADGPFVYTGFKPAWVMIKPTSYANSWLLLDNKRPGYNVTNQRLEADGSGAEYSGLDYADFLSNGFKIRTSNAHPNNSGGTLIYMAFAESPLVGTNNIPATAR